MKVCRFCIVEKTKFYQLHRKIFNPLLTHLQFRKYHEATLTIVSMNLQNKISLQQYFSMNNEDIAEDNKIQCEFHLYLHHFKYKILIYNKRQGGFIHPNVLRTR